ncbi:class I SAM-dependent methyltransferase [Nocardioides marinquilinus]|uniref:Class I SAM-dependent methyltransferase n=1 Tax=Nocardioides marinquilinus TaxID=1210400 RepID=A0ABP9PDD7_9ACTN
MKGAVPSPNIWQHTATYEVENRAVDPDGRLWTTLAGLAGPDGWRGRRVLDLGCGTGFHLPLFAETAGQVVGVEPHHDLLALAARRTRRLPHVTTLAGTAQAVPLPDRSVDVVHARWAYFFGPGCEPGLAELDRVVAPGGVALVVDNDGSRSTFGAWFRRGYPHLPAPSEIERFWATRGWTRTPVDMGWRFESRADLEAVVRIEFNATVAEEVLRHHEGLEVDYAVNVWSRRY